MSIAVMVGGWAGGGGGGVWALGIYNPLVRMTDDNLVGSSLKSDGTTNANGTLYPTGINDVAGIGSINSQIDTQQTALKFGGFFANDDYSYTTLQTKTKVAQKWFTKYKNFKQVKVAGMIQRPTKITALTNASNVIRPRRTLELSATALIHLYDINDVIYAICATIWADGALTYGTAVTIFSGAQNEEYLDICLIGTNKFAVVYKGTSNYSTAVVATVSGTTITLGTGVSMSAAITTQGNSICALGTDKFIVTYKNGSDSGIYAKAATVSGTVITPGTVSSSLGNKLSSSLIQNGTDKACIFYPASTASTEAVSLTVSGTTITLGSSVTITSGNEAWATRGASAQSNRMYDHVKLATDKILFTVYWSQIMTAIVITMSGNVITAGPLTVMYIQSPLVVTQNSGANPNYNAKLVEITAWSDYVFYGGYVGTRLTISGTSITVNGYTDSGGAVHYSNGATRYNIVYNSSSIWGLTDTYSYTNAIDTFKHVATGYTYIFGMIISSGVYYMFCSISNAISVSFYNDATLIGSPQTMTEAFLFDSYDISSAVTTGKRAYLGIKNNEATTRYLYLYETLLEVE